MNRFVSKTNNILSERHQRRFFSDKRLSNPKFKLCKIKTIYIRTLFKITIFQNQKTYDFCFKNETFCIKNEQFFI